MKRKGSITIYICLMMIIILSLITTGIRSVVLANARVSMVSAMDLGLYSLFGQYDRDFLDRFGVLFIDGGYGESDLQMDKVYQKLEEEVKYNLFAESFVNDWRPKLDKGAIEGYTLATDGRGSIFKEQVVSYMKETIGAQGIQLLMEKVQAESEIVQQQETDKKQMESGNIGDFEEIKRAQAEVQAQAEAQNVATAEDVEIEPPTPVASNFVNPIEVISELKKLDMLALVIADPSQLSDKEIDLATYVSQRELQRGMGVIPSLDESQGLTNDFLFQEYLLKKCGNYLNPSTSAALEYQIEYLVRGKSSDIENLKGVANRLLLIREAANILHLMLDSNKKAQVTSMASTIAIAMGVPQFEQVLEAILIACWAFGESLIDVRALFRGEKVPLIKSGSTWQLEIEQLAYLPELLNGESGSKGEGINYQGYLRILLLLESDEEKAMKGMDVIEMTMRSVTGRENFRMDSCIFSLDVEMGMNVAKNSYFLKRSYGYDM